MGRQKKRKPRKPTVRHEERFVPLIAPEDELVLAQALRTHCEECGSHHLHFGDVAAGALGARTAEQRGHLTEALTMFAASTWSAWWCMDCDNVGVFFPSEPLWG